MHVPAPEGVLPVDEPHARQVPVQRVEAKVDGEEREGGAVHRAEAVVPLADADRGLRAVIAAVPQGRVAVRQTLRDLSG